MTKRQVVRLLMLALLLLPTISFSRTASPPEAVVHAAGQGNPWMNLGEGHAVPAVWSGPSALTSALHGKAASPKALASADFDEDGVPDLVASYGLQAGGGMVTLSRGNVDAIYPNAPEAKKRKSDGTHTPEPFLSDVAVFATPEVPDFVGAGDFDADGHWDVVTARLGGKTLQFLQGDGKGTLEEAKAIDLPGTVTAMTFGEINRRDGLDDIIVGVETAGGPQLLVFEWPEGALRGSPESFGLPGAATSFALGQMDAQYPMDLAVAAGKHVVVLHGRDRGLSLDASVHHQNRKAALVDTKLPVLISSLSLGDYDGDLRPDLALLDAEGRVRLLSTHQISSAAFAEAEVFAPLASPGATLLSVRNTGLPSDGLMVVDPSGRRLRQLIPEVRPMSRPVPARRGSGSITETLDGLEGPIERAWGKPKGPGRPHSPSVWVTLVDSWAELDVIESPLAVLPMRLNSDALEDLVTLTDEGPQVSVGRSSPLSTFTVTNTNDTGPGSLRDAINQANATIFLDAIEFNIPGPGPHTITPASPLPPLANNVTVDGTTQPDFAGKPTVELDGSAAPSPDGLYINAGFTTVRGLAITGFPFSGIYANRVNSVVVEGCFLGVDTTGTVYRPNAFGVILEGTGFSRVGGTTAAARNILANDSCSILVHDEVDELDPNSPVIVRSQQNTVQGNFAGTDWTGTVVPNPAATNSEGIGVGGENNTVGGTSAGAGNVMTGMNLGLYAGGQATPATSGILVQGNFIGTNASGTAVLGPPLNGVLAHSYDSMTLGGTSPGAGNVIAGAVRPTALVGNVVVTSSSAGSGAVVFRSNGTLIQGNKIGTDATGTIALGGHKGISITGRAADTLIGGTTSGAANFIAGHDQEGIVIVANAAPGVFPVMTTIQGNYIGLGTTLAPLGNVDDGIELRRISDVLVGGSSPAARNVISGNGGSGVTITGSDSANNLIRGNFIGTDVTGTSAIPNGPAGVQILDAPSNFIGGSATGEGNLISGNDEGVLIAGATATGNTLRGNRIGTNASGTLSVGGTVGVDIFGAPGNIIGGTGPGEANVVSGNDTGVLIGGAAATGNMVIGNMIGTDPSGTSDVGNTASGMAIVDAPGNSILGNTISGNLHGVSLAGTNATANQIKGNRIGTDATGTLALGNDVTGIRALSGASDNIVGGTAAADRNIVAFNGAQGVYVAAGIRNALRGNSIHGNGALGIDLEPLGVTSNDYQDPDIGANDLQNYPVLTTVSTDSVNIYVDGSLNSTPNHVVTIDLYASVSCDSSGNGEGADHLGSFDVTTFILTGDIAFSRLITASVPVGSVLTATATDSNGSTSEFSACVSVTRVPRMVTSLDWSPGSIIQLDWTSVQEAVAYKLYEGSISLAPGLLTPSNDSCDRMVTQDNTSGKALLESPGPGNIYYYLVAAIDQNNVEGFAGEASAGLEHVNSPGACGSSCSHSKCVAGGPIDPACDPCVAQVCAAFPSCCGPNGWEANCVGKVLPVCGNVSCSPVGQCAHDFCKAGTPLQPGCDQGFITPSCVDRICQQDPSCCSAGWSASCVQQVATVCSLNCD